MTFLLWTRTSAKEPVYDDIRKALIRYRIRFQKEPEELMVPESLSDDYQDIAKALNLQLSTNKYLGMMYFGVK